MILHFITDEIFSDYVISQFSSPEMCSEVVCLNASGKMQLVEQRASVRLMSPYSQNFLTFLDTELGKYKAIVLHGMHWGQWQRWILEKVPDNVKVAWVFWGGEIYCRSDLGVTRFAPITKFITQIRNIKKLVIKAKKNDWELPIELYQRVDYCLTSEQEEFEFAKAFLKNEHLQHIWYTYYDIDTTLGAVKNTECNGTNVIVGNSATEECNYFDVIPRIKKYLRKDQRVVLPLSYGAPWVTNSVSKYAKFFIGDAAMPLLEFMPRNEYNKILQSCSTMIMGQYIPQAQGNILTGLWLGMRVYMSEKSIAYKFFKRIGAKVFSFESDFDSYRFVPLSEREKEENRKVLQTYYSRQHVEDALENMIKILNA